MAKYHVTVWMQLKHVVDIDADSLQHAAWNALLRVVPEAPANAWESFKSFRSSVHVLGDDCTRAEWDGAELFKLMNMRKLGLSPATSEVRLYPKQERDLDAWTKQVREEDPT